MEQVLDRSLLVTQYPEILNQSEITDTGEVSWFEISSIIFSLMQDYETFRMDLDSLLNMTDFEYFTSSLWALAKALNNTISGLINNKSATYADLQSNATLNMLAAQAEKINDTEFTMEDFTYRNNIVESIMFRNLEQTTITVSYNSVCKQQTMALFF